jgi:hypothetical protein
LPLLSNLLDQLSDEDERNQIVMAIGHHDKMMDGAVANVQKGESLVSEGKDMMKEAHFKLESGERMVFEGKAMMKEGHLKVVSEVSRIIGLCVRPVVSLISLFVCYNFCSFDRDTLC